ncbi:HIT-like domain-containing protein [Suillus fuscotomentosus]|uniref:HIT-like domain-containing protein n=1 Tax=Suillus fuscotomentosus TaxID=1912939 RepID=A0AAD4HKA7_9AGAM|nr:HIT-like domain-containing protein [Suillus fuscotomentosus]KAG1899652.1 HIT-like domain-containing protein [Suillus fuscotomentosus]
MAAAARSLSTCIFCKIIKGEIPSFKLLETETSFISYSFLDIGPLSKGHALIIPKDHAAKLHELPDEYLTDVLPIAKKIATAQGLENYNILQNNGRIAHQVCRRPRTLHVIPKPDASDEEGLVIGWPAKSDVMEEVKKYHQELLGKL